MERNVKAGTNHRYGIGAVSKMTGLTDHTIRVWERRYEAVVADRTDTGRRLYSEDDVEKLTLLKRLTDGGVGISQVAGSLAPRAISGRSAPASRRAMFVSASSEISCRFNFSNTHARLRR